MALTENNEQIPNDPQSGDIISDYNTNCVCDAMTEIDNNREIYKSNKLSPESVMKSCKVPDANMSISSSTSSLSPVSSVSSRKISSAISETDSGVDVEQEETEDNNIDKGEDKRKIQPDQDVINRLCNFDEEEEDELSDNNSDDSDSDSNNDKSCDQMDLTILELKHILSALIHDNVEHSVECPDQVFSGRQCSMCHQNIFSLFMFTGVRCEVCSFVVCTHCSTQVSNKIFTVTTILNSHFNSILFSG